MIAIGLPDYIALTREYLSHAAFYEECAQKNIKGYILDDPKPGADMDLIKFYKHQYDTINVYWLFCSLSYAERVGWFNKIVP